MKKVVERREQTSRERRGKKRREGKEIGGNLGCSTVPRADRVDPRISVMNGRSHALPAPGSIVFCLILAPKYVPSFVRCLGHVVVAAALFRSRQCDNKIKFL
jgi:hypothetical protein